MNELSDKNKPRNLEDIFREGMGEAEVTPSDRLWERIDHKLDTKEAVFYKERMVWFQRLAAACIVLVLFTGGYLFYNNGTVENPQLATSEKLPAKQPAEASKTAKIKTEIQTTPPQVAADNFSTTENTLAAKTHLAHSDIKDKSLNKLYSRNNHNTRIVAKTKAAEETAKLINEAKNSDLNSKANNPTIALIDESRLKEDKVNYSIPTEVRSQTELENKSGIADATTTIALNKTLSVAPETSSVVVSNEKTKRQSSRWAVSGKYASHYFNQNITLAENSSSVTNNNQNSFVPPVANAGSNLSEAMHEYDKNTMSGYSFNTSLGAAYQLNSHWALETGLAYTQNVATTTSSYIFNNSGANRDFNNLSPGTSKDKSNGVSVPTTALLASLAGSVDANNTGIVKTEAFDTQYRYRLVGIPVKVNYKTSGDKSFYYISGGLLTNFLMQAHVLSASPVVPDIEYNASTESPFQDLQIASTISIGRGFRITRGFSLKAGLEASKYLTSLAARPEYSEGKHGKPYTFGIALSSSYTLGK